MRRIDGLSARLNRAVSTAAQDHPLLIVIAFLLALAAIILILWAALGSQTTINANNASPIPVRPTNTISPVEIPVPTDPTHLTIPAMSIDATVENVGITKNGAMAVPKNTDNVGWFNLGYRPGEVGNAVLTGHVDTIWLRPAVFAKIDQLRVGDELNLTDSSAHQFTFVVRQVAHYNIHDLPLSLIFGPAPVPQLNLITCSGKWSWKIATYTERTVVYTSLK